MKTDKLLGKKASFSWWGYLSSVGLVVLATLIGRLTQRFLTSTDIVMLYLLCVVAAAVFWGLGPSIVVCLLSVAGHTFFFLAPFLSFGPLKIEDVPTLVVLLIVGVIISYLASQVRARSEEARYRQKETQTLYLLSRKLAATNELDSSIQAIMDSVWEALGCEVSLFLPDAQSSNGLKPYSKGQATFDNNEIAAWSFQHQERAGLGTDTFSEAGTRYEPMITARGAVGVMALKCLPKNLTTEQEGLLKAFVDLAAVAIDRISFAEETQSIKLTQAATEKLQTALLDSISHDLCTPLSSIIGVLTSLQEEGTGLNDSAKKQLINVAHEEAEELNNSITNLLDVSRIQAGTIAISSESCDVNDMISVALDGLGERLNGRKVEVDTDADLPFVSADFGLIVKVLFNLIDNAVKYSTGDSPIEIRAREVLQEVEIEVADRGIGVSPQHLAYIFERFYRVPNTNVSGAGLGLSICKAIVKAHGGRIAAANRPDGGTVFKFTLPESEVATDK